MVLQEEQAQLVHVVTEHLDLQDHKDQMDL
jgi:hypothetical protein